MKDRVEIHAEDSRPRILSVRFGVNPNSSSLGVDVTYLLFGGTLAMLVSLFLSLWLRAFAGKGETVGEPRETGGAP